MEGLTFLDHVYLEIIKIVVAIVIIGGFGYLIKQEITKEAKKKKEERKEKEIRGEFRTKVIDEYINIYSGFYEIRKIYNSIITENFKTLDLNTINNLKEKCLKDSVKFDAKFGSLKVRLSNHFELPNPEFLNH